MIKLVKKDNKHILNVRVEGLDFNLDLSGVPPVVKRILDTEMEEPEIRELPSAPVSSPLDESTLPVVQLILEDLDELHMWIRANPQVVDSIKLVILRKINVITNKYTTDDMVGN